VIGLDTNVLVRYIMRDDAKQVARADALIDGLTQQAPGFVSLVVVVEMVWVLESVYAHKSEDIASALQVLLAADTITVESPLAVAAAVRQYADGSVDFADALIACQNRVVGCERTMTFDKRAAKFAGMTLIR
jgi:predicted nucleic-acid-binding protein